MLSKNVVYRYPSEAANHVHPRLSSFQTEFVFLRIPKYSTSTEDISTLYQMESCISRCVVEHIIKSKLKL